jgi:hypothetical protein
MSAVDPVNGLHREYSGGRIIPTSTASLGGTAMAADVRDINSSQIWLRSSLCNPGKNCVEVGHTAAGVIIRDSKSKTALHALNNAAWTAFLTHCRTLG